DDPDRWMPFSKIDLLRDRVGIDPIVGRQEFAVLGFRRDRAERSVVVLDRPDELLVAADRDLWMPLRIFPRDPQRAIRAAVVYDRVVPTVIGLRDHAFDAGAEVLFAIEDRRDD